MKVGELRELLVGVPDDVEVKIGANLIREIERVEVTSIAQSEKLNPHYPWVAEAAFKDYKADLNTKIPAVIIQVK